MVHKESETIEFKKSTAELKEAVVAVAAMLNDYEESISRTRYFLLA